jgi:ABC-type glycerol-3-phosphate transport system permease component
MTSLKLQEDFRVNKVGFPNPLVFDNFKTIWDNFMVARMINGVRREIYVEQMLVYTVLYTVGGAFFSTLAVLLTSYAVAKFNNIFSKIIYFIVITTMILPIVGAAPSEISLLRALGLYNTIYGSWIQKFNFLGLYFLVMHATFRGIPKEYWEAAYIDGAGKWRTLLSIILPLVKNVLFTIMLIKFIDLWNDYQTPLLYLPSYPTLAFGVYELSIATNQALSYIPVRLAGCMMLLIPILIVFFIFKNKIMGNISIGGIKE